ncbi:MAG: flavodoxin family protein [Methanosarcinales archaeon]|jgi:multimeric flavodoxin WrbA|nr:flavodoxin family protein [Methanosarcinales archaeon]
MKIIGILGSAREGGSTRYLIEEVMKEPKAKGAETKIYNLGKMDIRCCLGCGVCRKKERDCVRKDDMRLLYEEMKTADAIIIGTPIYMGEMTGQLKTFIDRCFALKDAQSKPLIPAGKKLAVVITQGAPMPDHYIKTPDRIEYIFKGLGFIPIGRITAVSVHNTEELLQNKDVLEQARELGKQLL